MIKIKGYKSILLSVLLFSILIIFIIINIVHFNFEMNADIAADTQLARLMWQYKKIVPDSWIASSETILLCPSLLAAIIYGICHNMILSMGISCSVILFVEVGLLYWLCRLMDFNQDSSLIACIIFMAIPGATINQEVICLFAAYYSIHIITTFLALISYIQIKKYNKFSLSTIICILSSLVLSMQGMRIALVLNAPFLGMIILKEILDVVKYRKLSIRRIVSDRSNLFALALVLTSFIGLLSPYNVAVDSSRNIRHALEKFVNIVIPTLAEALNLLGGNALKIILNWIMLFIVLFVISYILVKVNKKFFSKDSVSDETLIIIEDSFVLLFFVISILLTVFMSTFTTAMTTARYFFMYYILAGLAMGYLYNMLTKKINDSVPTKFEKLKNILALLFLIIAIVMSVYNVNLYYVPVLKSNPYDKEIEKIVSLMESKDCYYGYSSFASAASISVKSNDRVQIAAIDDFSKMNISRWQTDQNWYVPNLPKEMPTAYLIQRSWAKEFDYMLDTHPDIELIGETENYLVYFSKSNYSCLE